MASQFNEDWYRLAYITGKDITGYLELQGYLYQVIGAKLDVEALEKELRILTAVSYTKGGKKKTPSGPKVKDLQAKIETASEEYGRKRAQYENRIVAYIESKK